MRDQSFLAAFDRHPAFGSTAAFVVRIARFA